MRAGRHAIPKSASPEPHSVGELACRRRAPQSGVHYCRVQRYYSWRKAQCLPINTTTWCKVRSVSSHDVGMQIRGTGRCSLQSMSCIYPFSSPILRRRASTWSWR